MSAPATYIRPHETIDAVCKQIGLTVAASARARALEPVAGLDERQVLTLALDGKTFTANMFGRSARPVDAVAEVVLAYFVDVHGLPLVVNGRDRKPMAADHPFRAFIGEHVERFPRDLVMAALATPAPVPRGGWVEIDDATSDASPSPRTTPQEGGHV